MRSVVRVVRRDDEYRQWWRPLLMRRCSACLPRGESHGYHGRCELRRGHQGVHALERGMEIVRFTDEWSDARRKRRNEASS